MAINNLAAVIPQPNLAALASTVRAAHQGVALAAANMIEHALAAGDALIAAKDAVKATRGPGHWLEWLRDECDLSEDRAERYMRIARGRSVLEANSARVRNLSLTGALKLLPSSKSTSRSTGSPRPGPRSPRPGSRSPSQPQKLTRHDVLGWLSTAPVDEGQHVFDGLGSRKVATFIPPNWDMMLVPAGSNPREVARLKLCIADLKDKLHQKAVLIEKMQRKLGPVFGARDDGNEDGLVIPAPLRREAAA